MMDSIVITPIKSIKVDKFVIIDWDDTLFPSEWVKDTDIDLRDESVVSNMHILELYNPLDHILCDLIHEL